ncbi:MAG: hypothetical protein IJ763_08045 [Lachnospiraceae bacterium]|nr:hypothetical protein [Lachnospiraceae bacterium]
MGNKNSSNKKNIKKINRIKNNRKDKSIYIVISKTSTFPSHVIKMWTKEPYAHTSIALDIELNEMYSFARRKLHNPFYCGFIREDITTGVFGRDVGTTCRVARLKVSANEYKKIIDTLKKFKKNDKYYKYNYVGIVGIMFNKAVEREYNYFCSQFVYHVLKNAGVETFDKKAGLVRPEDFRLWDELELVYEGKLKDYRQYLKDNQITEKCDRDYFAECMIKDVENKAVIAL